MFENNIRYSVLLDGVPVRVLGFRVGCCAVTFGDRTKNGIPFIGYYWVDHIPTKRTVARCVDLDDALVVADATALVLGTATKQHVAVKRVRASDFNIWVDLPSPKPAFLAWHRERFGKPPAEARLSRSRRWKSLSAML